MRKENLYFIAIIPSKEISDAITVFKSDFAHRFESKAALRVIPHVTLKAPFKLPVSSHSDLQQWFRNLSFNSGSFQIELKNFGAFRNKKHPVIYVQPILNASLFSLQKEIIRSFRFSFEEIIIMETELNFTPHITIAYRDLSFDKFLEGWKEYEMKEYQAVFEVSSFHLLQHSGIAWEVVDTFHIK